MIMQKGKVVESGAARADPRPTRSTPIRDS